MLESEILGKIAVVDQVPGKVSLGRVTSATDTSGVVCYVKEQCSSAPDKGSQEVTNSKKVSLSGVEKTKCGTVGS